MQCNEIINIEKNLVYTLHLSMLLLWTRNADVQFINAGQDSTFNH